jgi:hypothetical protein
VSNSLPTYREIETVGQTRTVRMGNRFVSVFGPLIRWVFRLPGVRSGLAGTLGGRSGTVFSLLDKKQFGEAFRLALDGVTHCETHESRLGLIGLRDVVVEMRKMYWWNFLQSAAQSATELGSDERERVLARLLSAPQPGGFVESQCMQMFSRWRWKAGDAKGALEFSRRGVLADPTWPTAHIDLAWFELVADKVDPLPRLREAVRLAPSVLAEIRAIPAFAGVPELIRVLEVGQTAVN